MTIKTVLPPDAKPFFEKEFDPSILINKEFDLKFEVEENETHSVYIFSCQDIAGCNLLRRLFYAGMAYQEFKDSEYKKMFI